MVNQLKKLSRFLFIAFACIAPVSCNAQTGDAKQKDSRRAVFVKYGCYECHGYEGQGAETGPRLAPDPLPREAFMYYVRHPARRMPPYAPSVLPDEDLEEIYQYLLSRTAAPAVDEIPLLSSRKE